MAQSAKCLPHKCENPSSIPRPCVKKSGIVVYSYSPSVAEVETGRFLGFLFSKLSPIREFQDNVRPCLQ